MLLAINLEYVEYWKKLTARKTKCPCEIRKRKINKSEYERKIINDDSKSHDKNKNMGSTHVKNADPVFYFIANKNITVTNKKKFCTIDENI